MFADRGFTAHEYLADFNLYNMNGRIYDPLVGRFLSPDPFMQAPDYTQGLNRYSYCMNNPLSLIDPSGYSWFSRNWKSLVAGLVAITVTVVTAGTGTIALGHAILSGAAGGFAGGFTGTLLNGGNVGDAFKAGVIGGVIGGIAAGGAHLIGTAAQGLGTFQKELARSLAHGSLGGLTSVAQGGKFKHGFFAGAFASMAGSGMQAAKWGVFQTNAGQLVTAAVVGGTASQLGGGKFANGAVTGAYTMLFNHMVHQQQERKWRDPGRANWRDSKDVYFKTKEWFKFIADGNKPIDKQFWNTMDIYENIEPSKFNEYIGSSMQGGLPQKKYYSKLGIEIYVAESRLIDQYRANNIAGIINNKALQTITLYGTYGQSQGVVVVSFSNSKWYNNWMDYIFK